MSSSMLLMLSCSLKKQTSKCGHLNDITTVFSFTTQHTIIQILEPLALTIQTSKKKNQKSPPLSSLLSSTMNLDLMPQDCFAHILSFASAREACQLSIISETIRSMADSDVVWDNFLPFDCAEVLSRLDTPVIYRTKKELYFKLCRLHHMDGGTKVHTKQKHTCSIYLLIWSMIKRFIL